MQSLDEEYQKLKREYDATQKDLIQEVLKTTCKQMREILRLRLTLLIAAGYVESLKSLTEVLATLDVLVAFAQVAVSAPKSLNRPQIMEKGNFSFSFFSVCI